MSDEPDSLVLRMLREMRGELGEMKVSMKELATTQAAILQIMANQENRLLRMEADVTQIRKRLELVEA